MNHCKRIGRVLVDSLDPALLSNKASMTGKGGTMIDQKLNDELATGTSLYEIVETYANFGPHHTGTEADHRTTDWVAGILERLDADITLPRYEFERYVCRAMLHANGAVVPAVPVFYSGYGHWQTTTVDVVEVDRSLAGQPTGLGAITTTAAANRGLAIAVDGLDDEPVHYNRVPAAKGAKTGPGRPSVIIPANWAERVRGDAHLAFDGALESGSSRNIVATLGSPENRRVNITTPLTGWTPCAGERGTGLAVALAMAADLAVDHYVVLTGCSGHELDHLGLRAYLSTENVAMQPVIHLGASVGAVEWQEGGEARLGSQRLVLTNGPEALRSGVAERAASGGWSYAEPQQWPGEGGTWREADASVLSFLGSFEHFHLATDLPEVATTPAAMERAARSAIDTARHFLSAGR